MKPVTTPEFLHLASESTAANIVEETLVRLGRHERVMAPDDTYAEGPLGDLDAGGASRIDWYKRINPDLSDDDMPEDDFLFWEEVRNSSRDIMLWHGPHPVERLFSLRACWHLRDQPERVHEVALPAREKKSSLAPFYGAVAIVGPNVTVPAWAHRAKVLDVSARAERWVELRDAPGEWLRALDGDDIVQLPLTVHDAQVIEMCIGGWTASLHLVATIIAHNAVGLSLLTWRIRELLGAGALQGRGPVNGIGVPTELRAADPTSSPSPPCTS